MLGSAQNKVYLGAMLTSCMIKLIRVTVGSSTPCVQGYQVVVPDEVLQSVLILLSDSPSDRSQPGTHVWGLFLAWGVEVSSQHQLAAPRRASHQLT